MPTLPPNLNLAWSRLLLEELARRGVRHVIISPGSRSTPLALAAAMTPQLATTVHFDERGAAYFALGQARACGVPSVLIATSGTAVANYLPAVVEASQEAIPLLLLTADRPPELRHTGANQTIDQVKLFGGYVRQFVDLPCPDAALSWRLPLSTAGRAYAAATGSAAGPVQLNCMFREPLLPADAELAEGLAGWPTTSEAEASELRAWASSGQPHGSTQDLRLAAGATSLPERIATLVAALPCPLLVFGQLPHRAARDAAMRLIARTGWPAIADISSGLRLAPAPPTLLSHHDLLLRSPAMRAHLEPQLLVQVGGHLTSKRLQEFIATTPGVKVRLVHDERLADNAAHLGYQVLVGHLPTLLDQLAPHATPPTPLPPHAAHLVDANAALNALLAARLDGDAAALSEPAVARALAQHLPSGQPLFLASSMPIRSMDTFASPTAGALHPVAANRGASGIDGTVATAAGYAQALEAPLTLLIGDLALLHDLNSLALLAQLQAPLVIVAINNDGGGIFHFLPVQRLGPLFERYFATPHGLQFAGAAAMFGLQYAAPTTRAEFVAAYSAAVQDARSTLIEVRTDRAQSAALYAVLGTAAEQVLAGLPE